MNNQQPLQPDAQRVINNLLNEVARLNNENAQYQAIIQEFMESKDEKAAFNNGPQGDEVENPKKEVFKDKGQ